MLSGCTHRPHRRSRAILVSMPSLLSVAYRAASMGVRPPPGRETETGEEAKTESDGSDRRSGSTRSPGHGAPPDARFPFAS